MKTRRKKIIEKNQISYPSLPSFQHMDHPNLTQIEYTWGRVGFQFSFVCHIYFHCAFVSNSGQMWIHMVHSSIPEQRVVKGLFLFSRPCTATEGNIINAYTNALKCLPWYGRRGAICFISLWVVYIFSLLSVLFYECRQLSFFFFATSILTFCTWIRLICARKIIFVLKKFVLL